MKFDPSQHVVLINGREIKDWTKDADAISLVFNAAAGENVMGVSGKGVFISDPDRSATLTIKMLQHSPDNKFLNDLQNIQRNDMKNFKAMSLEIRDLINQDVASAANGYFTDIPGFVRGVGHNTTQWVMVFQQANIKLEGGV
ncbi:phage protein [Thorsellia anophelis]|uniref:Uncharacterized protein n=1 Tax=Thorsellia anophelis DSM 18579 TaxID=1123402 RepID=A0A1I0CCL1_9GAMM|nr:phage protein [Thorsellia anophelis]SET17303.1 Protein of unknown function [Thorsellia anophelis DSM 18579]